MMGCVRRSVAASMVLAVGIALVASGCVSARPMPAPLAAGDPEVVLESRLDQAWFNTGLDGPRPDVEVGEPVEGDSSPIAECLFSSGHESFGFSDGPGGPVLEQIGSSAPTATMQLDFFACFAATPTIFEFSTPLFSPAQLDYLYDYYQELVIPCLAAVGVNPSTVPTREEYYGDRYGSWTPYEATIRGEGLLAYPEAVELCGDPHAGISAGSSGQSTATIGVN